MFHDRVLSREIIFACRAAVPRCRRRASIPIAMQRLYIAQFVFFIGPDNEMHATRRARCRAISAGGSLMRPPLRS